MRLSGLLNSTNLRRLADAFDGGAGTSRRRTTRSTGRAPRQRAGLGRVLSSFRGGRRS